MTAVYLITFLRHLKKHWNLAIINMLSFAFGIATCLILMQHIYNESSYEKFFNNAEEIYRLTLDSYWDGIHQGSSAHTFVPVGPELKAQYPAVKEFTTIQTRPSDIVTVGDYTYLEKKILEADINFFKVLPYKMILGSTNDVKPGDVYISRSKAEKYFGDHDPIGASIKILAESYVVRGVFENLPSNTHLKFDMVYTLPVRESNDWNVAYMYTYIRFHGDHHVMNSNLQSFNETISRHNGSQSDAQVKLAIQLQPITDIHLKSDLRAEPEPNGKIQDLYILFGLSILILVISCLNYVSLTNAINSTRSKEAFVKRIHGATKWHAALQHLQESLLLNLFSFAIAIIVLVIVAKWAWPVSNYFDLTIDWTNPLHYYIFLLVFLFSLVLSGILPVILSLFTKADRSSSTHSTVYSVRLTRNMAFLQFFLSFVLISGALVARKQLTFLQEGDLGFKSDEVVAIEVPPLGYRSNESHFQKVKNDLEKIAGIENVAFSNSVPGEPLFGITVRLVEDPSKITNNSNVQVVTSDYFEVYNIELVAGRLFSEERAGDENSVVVNESFAKRFYNSGYKNMAGKVIVADYMRGLVNFEVVGIVKDFFHFSKKEQLQPMLFIPLKNSLGVFRISVKKNLNGDWNSNLPKVQKILKENLTEGYANRGYGVGYDLKDIRSGYNQQFVRERQFSIVLNYLTSIALLMACIGFFGLASATTRKRTKEMVIRKVHGASSFNIAALFLANFFRLAGLAFLLALPVSFFLVQDWLGKYPLRIEIGSWFLIWPLLIASVMVIISVSYFVLKTVFTRPIDHLQNE